MISARNLLQQLSGNRFDELSSKKKSLFMRALKGFLLIFLGCQLLTFSVIGQSQKVRQKYEYGKELLKEGKNWQAIEVFKRLSKSENGDEIYRNSIYLHALALYKVDKKQEARQLLFLLADKYPTWGSVDEVRYLMAVIDFDWKSPVDALDNLEKITDKTLIKDAYNLKKAKLGENTVDRLKYLYAKYPDDEAIGKVLLTKLYETNGGTDLKLLEELQDKYNSSEKVTKVDKNTNFKRDSYNVAVLLPFNEEQLSPLPQANFVVDLYEGILIGLDDLQKKGVKINLFTYDTKRDSATTAQLLANEDMQSMDLMIGPLYGNTLPLAQKFSMEYKVPLVNPISDNSLIIKDNPYCFLLSAGFETIAKSVSSYATENLKGKEAIIIHGSSVKDTLTAKAFQDHVTLMGGKVHKKVEFAYDDYAYSTLINDLGELKQDTGKYYVYIASSDVVIGRTSLSALQNLLFEGIVFGSSKWLEVPQMSYTRMEISNVHFVNPLHYDEESEAAKKFTSNYVKKVKLLPSKYAFMGYETMSYFGSLLNNYGMAFPRAIHQENNKVTGALFKGIHYRGGNDNQQISILKFEDGVLQPVNRKEGFVEKN